MGIVDYDLLKRPPPKDRERFFLISVAGELLFLCFAGVLGQMAPTWGPKRMFGQGEKIMWDGFFSGDLLIFFWMFWLPEPKKTEADCWYRGDGGAVGHRVSAPSKRFASGPLPWILGHALLLLVPWRRSPSWDVLTLPSLYNPPPFLEGGRSYTLAHVERQK